MKLIAVHDKAMYMFVADEICISSWTCRMQPWDKPTLEDIEESKNYIDK